MRIESYISYWKSNGLSFNPEKIIVRLRKEYFPELETDWKDQSRIYFERFFENIKKKSLEPPDFVVESKWNLFSSNSPTFLFTISLKTLNINGNVNRYVINFETEKKFDLETEKKIINFLTSLKYGDIKSDTKTKYFCKQNENYKNYWNLDINTPENT